ncbi:MAG: ATP-binding protein [Desulfurococcaceae archaeon]
MGLYTSPREDFIFALFGKPFEVLTCREVCEKLEAINESSHVEFKESFEKEDMLKRELLRTITGFLNTAEGYGFVALGVRDPSKPGERVKCLDKNLFKWDKAGQIEAHIRDTILGNLKSIPRAVTPPHLGVKIFDCRSDCGLGEDGWLILVYVERTSDAVYYSKIDNTAYTRRASTTQPLSLEETFALVESKRKPMVRVLLGPRVEEPRRLKFTIWLENIGYKPAMHTLCKLRVNGILESSNVPMPIFIQSIEPIDELRGTPILELGLQYVIELYNIYPFDTPVFPGIELYKGELEAVLNTDLPEQATMTIEASIFTEDTVTQEKIVIDASRNTATTRKVTLEVRDYLGNILLQGTAEN